MKRVKHHPKKINHLKHVIMMIVIGLGLIFATLVLGNIYFEKVNPVASKIKWGVSFSIAQTKSLGLDWQKTYLGILDDLKVGHIRLSTPWKDLEAEPDKFNFEDTDFMLSEADKRQIRVLLVLGAKQPRWPECQLPKWTNRLSKVEKQQRLLNLIEKVVLRYKNNRSIWAWQIENEPLFPFGDKCDAIDRQFLKEEVALVKRLDRRPLVLTDSGELGSWRTPMALSDIFGTTLYRTVHSEFFGYFYWPLPPAFYNVKSFLIKKFFAPNNQRTIIIELQAEPWSPKALNQMPIDQQIQVFSADNFKDNIIFGKRTGFDEIYLWGVEWWYYMQTKGQFEYLELAKKLFR